MENICTATPETRESRQYYLNAIEQTKRRINSRQNEIADYEGRIRTCEREIEFETMCLNDTWDRFIEEYPGAIRPVAEDVNYWHKEDKDGGISWALFRTGTLDMAVEDIIENLEDLGWETSQYYRGPGQPFRGGVAIRQVGKRILVTQRFGLDI